MRAMHANVSLFSDPLVGFLPKRGGHEFSCLLALNVVKGHGNGDEFEGLVKDIEPTGWGICP